MRAFIDLLCHIPTYLFTFFTCLPAYLPPIYLHIQHTQNRNNFLHFVIKLRNKTPTDLLLPTNLSTRGDLTD